MPHLSNCPHHDTGWCINCVKELQSERDALYEVLDAVKKTIDLSSGGSASGVSLALVDAVRRAEMPFHIREWLIVNDDVPPSKLKCPKCGEWFGSIDHLAPYHWEACWCEKCKCNPLVEKE